MYINESSRKILSAYTAGPIVFDAPNPYAT